MKKKILSQMMILSFAFAGLFMVGNNVFAQEEVIDYIESEDGSWKNCRHHNGSGVIPSIWRDCGTCSTAFFSSGSRGKCYK